MVSQSLEIQAKSYKIIQVRKSNNNPQKWLPTMSGLQVVCAQLVYLVFLSPSVSSPECLVFRRELQM